MKSSFRKISNCWSRYGAYLSFSLLLKGKSKLTLSTLLMALMGMAIRGLLQQVMALHLPLKYFNALSVTCTHLLKNAGFTPALYFPISPWKSTSSKASFKSIESYWGGNFSISFTLGLPLVPRSPSKSTLISSDTSLAPLFKCYFFVTFLVPTRPPCLLSIFPEAQLLSIHISLIVSSSISVDYPF
jgi:hypothetical protein